MKHAGTLFIKLAIIESVTAAILIPLANATVAQALVVGFVGTVILYVLGDLMVLPAMGNGAAVAGDTGIALLVTWLAPLYTGINAVSFWTALLTATVIGVIEYFFHPHVQKIVLPGSPAGGGGGEDN